MRILMLTNTYPPIVSGVARSIVAFEEEYRQLGHEVLVVAPEADGENDDGNKVVRVPAIQHVNGSEFPVPIPSPGLVASTVDDFKPDVIHAHHPFFMGNAAMRMARSRLVPLVFTHHTMWDQYTHYIRAESPATAKFIGAWVAGYANLCNAVIAPSQSVADLLRERGVEAAIEIIPTGVDAEKFSRGDGKGFREKQGIPAEALVVGYVGRLAHEKNLDFLASAVTRFLSDQPHGHFLVVGSGPCEDEIHSMFAAAGLAERLHLAGVCEGQKLIDAYHALDIFAFASQTETQGMVLTEAMAAGKPVVALDGPGVRDVVQDRINGRLVLVEKVQPFVQALAWAVSGSSERREKLCASARQTAERFSMRRQAARALALYESLLPASAHDGNAAGGWECMRRRIEAEWTLWSNLAQAAARAMESEEAPISNVS